MSYCGYGFGDAQLDVVGVAVEEVETMTTDDVTGGEQAEDEE